MTYTPLVTVLIPTHNSEAYVARALQSALAQSYPRTEIVVSDNASCDATVRIVRDYVTANPHIRVLQSTENLGPVRNWRKAVESARGEYSALLFSDDWYEPAFISEASKWLADPEIGFVYSSVRIHREIVGREWQRIAYDLGRAGSRETVHFMRNSYHKFGYVTPVSPGCALMRTADLARWLSLELPDSAMYGYFDHGAGPDLCVYLQACVEYPRYAHVAGSLVNFSSHGGNLSSGGPGIKTAYVAALWAFYTRYRLPQLNGRLVRCSLWLLGGRRTPHGLSLSLSDFALIPFAIVELAKGRLWRRLIALNRGTASQIVWAVISAVNRS